MIFGREPALWIEVIRTGLLLAILFGLHLSDQQLAGVMVFLGTIALLITRGSVTPNAKVNTKVTTERTLKLVPIAIAASLLLGVSPASAKDLPWLSAERLAGGVVIQGSVYSNAVEGGDPAPLAVFAPKAYLSYGLLEEVSAHASYQVGVGAVRVDEFHAGGAVRILREDPVRVSVGVDAVRYLGADAARLGQRDVTEYSLRASKVLKRSDGAPRLGIQFQPAYVPANQNFVYRLGLNWSFSLAKSDGEGGDQ